LDAQTPAVYGSASTDQERPMVAKSPQAVTPTETLVRQLLAWVAEEPRTYSETMDAWSTHCPHFPIWEDALDFRLIEVASPPAARLADRPVRLTARGRSFLEQRSWA
jgi:hypothetical protein